MARKKSRGSKKSSARRSRSSKSSEEQAEEVGSSGGQSKAAPKKRKKSKKTSRKSAAEEASAKKTPGKKSKKKSAKKTSARKSAKKSSTEGAAAAEATEAEAIGRGEPEVEVAEPDATEVEVAEPQETDPEAIVLDAEPRVDDLVAATAAVDEEAEAIPIDADESDADARARLIAETLALVAEEAGDEAGEAATATEVLEIADDLRRRETPDDDEDGGEAAPAASTADDPDAEGQGELEDTAAGDARPLIGPQALLALSEIHAEGLASLPEELVLDLGDATSPQERDRLLAAALAHAEMQEAIYRVPTRTNRIRRIKLGIAAVVALLALFAAVRPPALVVPQAPAELTVQDRLQGARIALLLQAQQIEAHRVASGALPRTLDEVTVRLPGIRYVRSTNRSYQLIGYSPLGEPIVYDSAAPDAAFERLRGPWSTRSRAS